MIHKSIIIALAALFMSHGSAEARTTNRHHHGVAQHLTKHAHLTKHPHQVAVTVHIPKSAFVKRAAPKKHKRHR